MVINPSWYVPRSIAMRSYIPNILAGGSTYMQLLSNGRVVNPRSVNMGQYSVSSFPFDLRQPPDDPALVNVLFDGEPIPFDADDSGDGWIYSSGQTLTVVGRYCQDLKDLTVTRVRIQEGCPSIVN